MVRLSEEKTKSHWSFLEREYLRAELKGTIKRGESQIYLRIFEREYLRMKNLLYFCSPE